MTIERAAIVADGSVIDIVRVETDGPLDLDGLHLIPTGSPVAIGWVFDGADFSPRPVPLEEIKAARISMLTAACASAIVGGFESSALGSPHTYPSKPTDQTNLMGSVVAALLPGQPEGWTTPFWASDASGEWAFRAHSAAEIIAVGADGKAHVVACQTRLAMLSAAVSAATDGAAVAAIGW